MTRQIRGRFWVEAGLAVASTILLAITLTWNDWIEIVFKINPDDNNGAVEWIVVAMVLAIPIVSFALARYEWRRAANLTPFST